MQPLALIQHTNLTLAVARNPWLLEDSKVHLKVHDTYYIKRNLVSRAIYFTLGRLYNSPWTSF